MSWTSSILVFIEHLLQLLEVIRWRWTGAASARFTAAVSKCHHSVNTGGNH